MTFPSFWSKVLGFKQITSGKIFLIFARKLVLLLQFSIGSGLAENDPDVHEIMCFKQELKWPDLTAKNSLCNINAFVVREDMTKTDMTTQREFRW